MVYTTEQQRVIDLCINAINTKRKLTKIGGYAGTGKSTCLKEVVAQCSGGATVAFMGKACEVLRRKGVEAQTIHSLIYKYSIDDEAFYLKDDLDTISWIVLEEASMVGSSLYGDLCSFKLPIVAFGDPGQLEPVDDLDIGLMKNCDMVLEEVHRQALHNPIIKLSMGIRNGDDIDWGPFIKPVGAIHDNLLSHDVIICGKNETRLRLNAAIRKITNKHGVIDVKDRIICRQNDAKLGVYNGSMWDVSHIIDIDTTYTKCVINDGTRELTVKIAHNGFNQLGRLEWSRTRQLVGRFMIADYGFAITCHSSQGSEWPNVGYIDEHSHLWDQRKHRYTGVTRAIDRLTVYKSPLDY